MSDTLQHVRMNPEWRAALEPEFLSSYMHELRRFLSAEKQAGKEIYPPGSEMFNAFNTTPLSKVKVVILGQDPYHGPRQAHGLCFSVRRGIQPPPSLVNIYKEIQSDLGIAPPRHGELTHWAAQGVLLLNSVLSVQAGLAASHQGRGWETFTDAVIRVLNEERDHLVFLLWGNYAQRKGRFIDARRHLVLKAAHPSPLSANRGGWFGCRHFSQANRYLEAHGVAPIDWSLPD
ncbi:MAG TPA: uracil-DNA glycosylase [Candidatus Kapabacteria bacterium]|nr:uracil-DNA glycosylase [Candidatus Kapabacteria bacterium]